MAKAILCLAGAFLMIVLGLVGIQKGLDGKIDIGKLNVQFPIEVQGYMNCQAPERVEATGEAGKFEVIGLRVEIGNSPTPTFTPTITPTPSRTPAPTITPKVTATITPTLQIVTAQIGYNDVISPDGLYIIDVTNRTVKPIAADQLHCDDNVKDATNRWMHWSCPHQTWEVGASANGRYLEIVGIDATTVPVWTETPTATATTTSSPTVTATPTITPTPTNTPGAIIRYYQEIEGGGPQRIFGLWAGVILVLGLIFGGVGYLIRRKLRKT